MMAPHLAGILIGLVVLGGCSTSPVPAPVEERARPSSAPATSSPATTATASGGLYTVKKGDTLYSIALDHGQDYRDIASWNALDNPNVIKVGQQLKVVPPDEGAPVAVARPVTSSGPVEVRNAGQPPVRSSDGVKREPKGGKQAWSEDALARARQSNEAVKPAESAPTVAEKPSERPAEKPPEKPVAQAPASDDVDWIWPSSGKLMTTYSEAGSKGLDIAGKPGEPVFAAAAGTVSYSGSGLRGYGNLVVLRHNANLLSVYAHNSKLLVKEKDVVTKGQKIAEIGSSDTTSPRLHFEIRRQGKPVDPQKYLPAR